MSTKQSSATSPLPEATLRLFDDYDPAVLAEPKSQAFVIERLLEAGDRHDLRWMAKTFDETEIRRVFHEARSLSRRSLRFWSLVLEGELDTEASAHEELWPL